MKKQIQLQREKVSSALQAKQKQVEELAKLAKSSPVIAIADLRNLPDKHLQSLRKRLRGQATVAVTRNTVLVRALQKAGRGTVLVASLKEPVAVIFTSIEPFKLFKIIKLARGKAAAKPGQFAPFDLIVPAGETALPPGPVLTELKGAGIQAQIQAGKVVISKDSTVAKKGEKISDMSAKALQKLGIEPFEVGVELIGAWQDGVLYMRDVLDVDEAKFLAGLQRAHQNALNLAVYAVYPTKASMPILITRAAREAKGLALEANIYEKDVIEAILAKAFAQANALRSKTGS